MSLSGMSVDKAALNRSMKAFKSDKKIRSISMHFDNDVKPTVVEPDPVEKEIPALPAGQISPTDGILVKLCLKDQRPGYFLLNCRLSTVPKTGGSESFMDYAVFIMWCDDDGQSARARMVTASTWESMKKDLSKSYGRLVSAIVNSPSELNNKFLFEKVMEGYKIVGNVVTFEGSPVDELQ